MKKPAFIQALTLTFFSVMVVAFIAFRAGAFDRYFIPADNSNTTSTPKLFLPGGLHPSARVVKKNPDTITKKTVTAHFIDQNAVTRHYSNSEFTVLMSTSKSIAVIPTDPFSNHSAEPALMSTSKSTSIIQPGSSSIIPAYIIARLFGSTQKQISRDKKEFHLEQSSSANPPLP